MPNHITTEVEIKSTKEKIDDLIKRTKIVLDSDAETNQFDFNGIVSMPQVIFDTTSPTLVVETQKQADELESESKKNHRETWGRYLTTNISKAESERRMKEYGALNWYDWSINNWGTKWNAYEVRLTHYEDTKLVIEIQTAWGTPHKIWTKLEEMGFSVKGVYYGEMEGYEFIGEDAEEVWEAYQEVSVEYIG